ncbi:BnaC08g11500D [Brassica napus]|uniref:BnaC08g11500D protein n=1 Tax=Brassica napus TaxID=3708 RepID=A0A078F318_BRANA|nr:BnaC08g11500D [Brassica napus]
MTSIPGTDVSIFPSNLLFDLSFVKYFSYCLESLNKNLTWSDEQTRFFLQLRLDDNLKGNIRKQMVNEAGRQAIIDKFYEAFGVKIPWRKFGIKYNTCKKQYESFKKLTRNRTGLGFDSTGFINMSEDWWNERCKEWPGARKFKDKPIANMDLMEKVFGTVYISGGEGWSAQQGEDVLDTKHSDHDDEIDGEDDAESRRDIPTEEAVGAESRRGVPTQETDVASESRNFGSKNQDKLWLM